MRKGREGADSTAAGSFPLDRLPEDLQLEICNHMDASSLLSLSRTNSAWHDICVTEVWPRRLATCLSVRTVRVSTSRHSAPHAHHSTSDESGPQDKSDTNRVPKPHVYFRILRTLQASASARTLVLCVHLGPSDTLTSLALTYAISRHEICRANSLYAEHHMAARTHLYIPMVNAEEVCRLTEKYPHEHVVCLVRDHALSNKLFAVVGCRPCAEHPACGRSGNALVVSRSWFPTRWRAEVDGVAQVAFNLRSGRA